MTSMLQQERAEALDLVVDAILAERPPIDAGVDRKHRLVEPELRDAGKPRHREIGADLDDGVDVRSVHFEDGVAQLALRHMRNQHGTHAFESFQAHDLETAIGKEAADLRVADRHIGCDHADALRPMALQRRARRVRAHRDLDAGPRLDPLAQLLAALEPVPERLRRHAHDQIVGLARHHVVDCLQHLLADVLHQLIEIVIVADRIVGDVDAAEVIGDAAWPHGFELRLHGGVGRGRDHAEFLAEARRSWCESLPQIAGERQWCRLRLRPGGMLEFCSHPQERAMLRTGKEHLESLRDGRVVYLGSERVEDVTRHAAFCNAAATVAALYDMKADPANRDSLTYEEDGGRHSIYFLRPRTREDLQRRMLGHRRIADVTFGMFGRSPDHVASFVTGMAIKPDALPAPCAHADNLLRYYRHLRDNDVYVVYAVLPPQAARNPEFYERQNLPVPTLRVVGEADDGVVISGMKMLATGALYANEIWIGNVLPLAPDQKKES